MKKTTAIIFSALILMSVICNVFAVTATNRVYADTVTVEAGEQITVPIKIENNDGFMGFAVIVTYNDAALTPVSVSKGTMLTGMFNDSIETSTDNSFKVIFTGTGDIVSDGVLFNVVFDVSEDASGTYEIGLSYSQTDTFKEGWSNAVFSCENAEIVVTVNGTTAPTTEATTEPLTPPATEPTTGTQEPTTLPSVTEPSTEPSSSPGDGVDDGKSLSVRMREWVNRLPFPLNIIFGIFVNPLALIISIFE